MGQIDLPAVEPKGNKTSEEYQRYIADVLAIFRDEIVNILEGRLSSVNIREVAGFLVDMLTLKHKSGLVGMSAADPTNPDAVRFWAGDADLSKAPYRVLQKGSLYAVDAFLTGLITGSKIIGSEIKTSETEYPRIELSSLGTFFKALGSATKSIEISVSTSGTPGMFFKDGAGTALMDIDGGVFDLLSTIGMSIFAPTVSAGGSWSFANVINGSITGHAASADYADHAGTAAAADNIAPSGNVAWGQVLKGGSNVADLAVRNLSSLTEDSLHRTVTDGEKSTWNAKASTSYVDNAVSGKLSAKMFKGTGVTGAQNISSGIHYATLTIDYSAAGFANPPRIHAYNKDTLAAWVSAITPITATSATIYLSSTVSGEVAGINIEWDAIET